MAAHAHVCRLTPEQVDRLRRAHIAMALAEVVAERGGRDAGVGEIVARAGVSRKTFYRLFSSKDEACAAAADIALQQAIVRMRAAWRAAEDPADRIPSALRALLELVDRHPERARLYLSEPVVQALPELAAALRQRSEHAGVHWRPAARPPADGEPRDVAARTVKAVVFDDTTALLELQSEPAVAEMATAALAGGPIAVLELGGHAGRRGPASFQARRALAYLEAHPGAAGREVQDALGHRHSSQTSRLLRRLADQGLAVDAADPPQHPAWRLTAAGRAFATETSRDRA